MYTVSVVVELFPTVKLLAVHEDPCVKHRAAGAPGFTVKALVIEPQPLVATVIVGEAAFVSP